jgi:hypothetical protein
MSRFGWAWLALALALGVHVADEATSGFLAFYNPLVLSIRAKVPLFPMPTFTYDLWISGLIMFVLTLLALTFQAFEGKRWLLWPAMILGVIMTMNGLGHIVGSVYYGRILPGTWSAPLLLITGPWLVREVRRDSAQRHQWNPA